MASLRGLLGRHVGVLLALLVLSLIALFAFGLPLRPRVVLLSADGSTLAFVTTPDYSGGTDGVRRRSKGCLRARRRVGLRSVVERRNGLVGSGYCGSAGRRWLGRTGRLVNLRRGAVLKARFPDASGGRGKKRPVVATNESLGRGANDRALARGFRLRANGTGTSTT